MRALQEVQPPPRIERAVLVGHAAREGRAFERSMEELSRLADTAGARPAATLRQRRGSVNAAHYIGRGKMDELRDVAGGVNADVAIFNDDLCRPRCAISRRRSASRSWIAPS